MICCFAAAGRPADIAAKQKSNKELRRRMDVMGKEGGHMTRYGRDIYQPTAGRRSIHTERIIIQINALFRKCMCSVFIIEAVNVTITVLNIVRKHESFLSQWC